MNNENFELENMRQQMETLKKKLDKQEIVNDRFIRHSMEKTASNISRRYNVVMVLGILMVPYFYWVFIKLSGFSMTFWIASSIFMLICVGATYYNSRNLNDSNMMTNNLVDVRRRMARAKKFDADWLFFGVPAVILWFGWFVYEIYLANNHDLSLSNPFFWGGCCGGVIGAICGYKMHFNTQRQYQDIIDQIEDLTAED
jgi:hypothetical protein